MSSTFNHDKELSEFFTDVEHLRDWFKNAVAAPTLPKRLLVIHGVGGVGKSSLLRMFRLHCKSVSVPVALASGDEAKSALDVLTRWTEDLKADGIALPTFGKTYEHYRAIQAKVENESAKTAEKLAKGAAKTVIETAASTIPGVGPLVGKLGGMGAEALVDWLRGFLTKPDIDLLLDPAKKLTDDFLADVANAANKRRIVLMLDTFEQMTALDDWARDVAQRVGQISNLPEGQIKNLSYGVLLVIAGRALPNWSRAWDGFIANAQIEELKPMTEEVMRELIQRYYATMRGGEPNPTQVEAIIRFARGLPMVVTSAVQLWVKYGVEDFQSVKAEIVANLVDRLMEGVPKQLIPALEAAAVVRWFDQPILRAVLKQDDVRDVYNELRRFPFVRTRVEGLALHDAVREIMDENLRAQDSERHCELHERAAAYFEKRLEKTTGEEAERLGLALLYHRFQTDEKSGAILLQELFERVDRLGQQEIKVKLLDEAYQYRFRDPQNAFILKYLEARSARDWKEREVLFRTLLDKDVNTALRAKVLRSLGDSLAFQGKSEDARVILEQALVAAEQAGDTNEAAWVRLELSWRTRDLDQSRDLIHCAREVFLQAGDDYGLATAELELGYNFLGRWQPDEARRAFTRCESLREKMGLRRSAAMAQERIGQTYLIEGNLQKAIACKETALRVFEEIQDEWNVAWTLDELATCYIPVGRWKVALDVLDRAQPIFARWNDHRETACVARKGHVYRLQGNLEHAMEMYLLALNQMPRHNAWTRQEIFIGIGKTHQELMKFDDAQLAFQQAIAEFQVDGMEFEAKLVGNANLGSLCLAQGQLDDALKHYSLCLETAQSCGNHIFQSASFLGLVRVKHAQGEHHAIPPLLAEAEQLAQQYEYNDHLASLRLTQGHVGQISNLPYETNLSYYKQAMIYALRYNRFLLDEVLSGRPQGTPLRPIIPYCLERGEEGRRMLIALRDWWQTGVNDIGAPRPDTISPIPEGIPLLEAEPIAREREPGDGSPQKSVVEQIEAAL